MAFRLLALRRRALPSALRVRALALALLAAVRVANRRCAHSLALRAVRVLAARLWADHCALRWITPLLAGCQIDWQAGRLALWWRADCVANLVTGRGRRIARPLATWMAGFFLLGHFWLSTLRRQRRSIAGNGIVRATHQRPQKRICCQAERLLASYSGILGNENRSHLVWLHLQERGRGEEEGFVGAERCGEDCRCTGLHCYK